MYLTRLIVKNFKSLRDTEIDLNPHLNVLVGDNETGKSTLLEAINLVLSCQIKGRNIQYELNPFLFNNEVVTEFLEAIRNGKGVQPPSILIEAYLPDDESLAKYRGTNNSLRENCPGVKLIIEFDEEYSEPYQQYIGSPSEVRTIPIEYYVVRWFDFANNPYPIRNRPLDATYIDASLLRGSSNAERYILKIISDVLNPQQRVELSLAYRQLKDIFLNQGSVKKINAHLAEKKGDITDKDLSVSLDVSARSAWETTLVPHLNDIPFSLAGSGEQASVNTKLAIEASEDSHIFLVEEPENHLSYPNMNRLISKISAKAPEKQIVVATHSSFVLNKLGIENVILFNRNKSMKLDNLSAETRDYFLKLPGHDTLRLILSQKAILVEGPSDELIVQKAFIQKHGVTPLEIGIDVITINSLAFKRFLEIATMLNLTVKVVTDNDGDLEKLREKYAEYLGKERIEICYDEDVRCPTLEPQLLKANSLEKLNQVFGTEYKDDNQLLAYMKKNKTEWALKLFNSGIAVIFPEYIQNAIN